jgi:hypothetical protein
MNQSNFMSLPRRRMRLHSSAMQAVAAKCSVDDGAFYCLGLPRVGFFPFS